MNTGSPLLRIGSLPARARLRRVAVVAVALVALITLGTAAAAQRAPRRAGTPEQRLAHLTQRLELSAEQQERIKPILEEEASELRALFQQKRAAGERGPVRDQVQAIRSKSFERIEAELTDAQKEEFRSVRVEQHERMERRQKRRDQAGEKPSS